MKKHGMELLMGCLLLVSFFFLSRQAAEVSGNLQNHDKNKKVIALDPGHGGDDPGMVGVEGLEEKNLNLAIALKLRDILEEKGFQAVMTREEDRGLHDSSVSNKKAQDMQRRVAFLEKTDPVCTVSIHQNSFSDPGVKGPQVFYYEGSEEGRSLAEQIQKSMNRILSPHRPRRVKGNSSYYLLKRSKGTVVIAECGFLTNPEEAQLLRDDEYQQKVAGAIAEGILVWLKK